MSKRLNGDLRGKAGVLAKQYTTDELDTQIYRAAFLNGIGKLLFWTATGGFAIVAALMSVDVLLNGMTPEKAGMFLHMSLLMTVCTGCSYLVFRRGPRRDLLVLEEAHRLREAADRTGDLLERYREKLAQREPKE